MDVVNKVNSLLTAQAIRSMNTAVAHRQEGAGGGRRDALQANGLTGGSGGSPVARGNRGRRVSRPRSTLLVSRHGNRSSDDADHTYLRASPRPPGCRRRLRHRRGRGRSRSTPTWIAESNLVTTSSWAGGGVSPSARGISPGMRWAPGAAIAQMAPALIGADPRRVLDASRRMDEALAGHAYAKAALEVALWDILAKANNLRLCDLLGGASGDTVPAYAAIGVEPPDAAVEHARRLQDEGYQHIQVKVGGRDLSEDITAIRQVRKALAPEVQLAVDANRSWTTTDAVLASNACPDVQMALEQPCASCRGDGLPAWAPAPPRGPGRDRRDAGDRDARDRRGRGGRLRPEDDPGRRDRGHDGDPRYVPRSAGPPTRATTRGAATSSRPRACTSLRRWNRGSSPASGSRHRTSRSTSTPSGPSLRPRDASPCRPARPRRRAGCHVVAGPGGELRVVRGRRHARRTAS